MKELNLAVETVTRAQQDTKRPLAIILAGHNGSGKSTMWNDRLSGRLQMPLINADRMMLSILPEVDRNAPLPEWAQRLRDTDKAWSEVARDSVQAFVAKAAGFGVPFAVETVFSHWKKREDGTIASKIDNILQLQKANYFVLLLFVGLESSDMSILRVQTRVAQNGHDVPRKKLLGRFPRTQRAIREALGVADASILTDNSREPAQAFTVCRVQLRERLVYDIRHTGSAPRPVESWLNIVAPGAAEA